MYKSLKNVPHLHVYRKKEVPVDLHFTNNRRISPLVIVPSEGWVVSSRNGRYVKDLPDTELGHGFSCECKSMSTAFIARGPAFKKHYIGKPFDSVSLYPLMCKILGIKPLQNNGTLTDTQDLLRN